MTGLVFKAHALAMQCGFLTDAEVKAYRRALYEAMVWAVKHPNSEE